MENEKEEETEFLGDVHNESDDQEYQGILVE